MKVSVHRDELLLPFTLAELEASVRAAGKARIAQRIADGYKTSEQWADLWGVSTGQARRRLRQLFHKGLLEHTALPDEGMDGQVRWVPAYKILDKEE